MSTLFLRNPRLTLLTIGLITVAGLSSYAILPRMEDPILTERAAFVLTQMPGADADQVESLVTEPIEDELRDIAEIKEVRSSSRASFSTITIELRDDVYGDEAATIWSQIRDRLADAETRLPPTAGKPRFERIEVTAYTRLIALIWNDPTRSAPSNTTIASASSVQAGRQTILRRQAEELREQLLAVSGTKDVEIFGAPTEEITVETDTDLLAATGLTAAEVSSAIAASDSRFSAGLLRGDRNDLLLELSGKLNSTERIAAIPLKTLPSGQQISVGDVATVSRSLQQPPSEIALVDGQRAIVLACLIRPNQRIDKWSQDSEIVTEEYRSTLPASIRLVEVFSQDGYVTVRLKGLLQNLLIGAGSVMVVILVLMGWRSAVIVGAALPLAAFMVLMGMRVMQIPVHQMSVTGLIIALGLLIDNAIVVVDEVSQKLRAGRTTAQAVGETVQHLAVPLFGSTFTTALAFGPIALMPGPAGEFVGAIAINVIMAIFSSLFLAMTIIPALTGFINRWKPTDRDGGGKTSVSDNAYQQKHNWWQDGFSSERLTNVYRSFLSLIIRRPALGILAGAALPIFGFVQARLLAEQFFPPADRDQVSIELDLPPQTSLNETLKTAQRIRTLLLANEKVQDVTWWVGRSAPPFYYNQIPARRGQSQYAQALVKLSDATGLRQQINALQQKLDQAVPQGRILVRQLEQGPPFEAPIEVEVFGPDVDQLRVISDQVNHLLADIPEVTHVRAEIAEPQPRLTFEINEHEARMVGLSHQAIAEQMFTSLEGRTGGLILEGTEEIPVRVRSGNATRSDVDSIESLHLLPAAFETRSSFNGIPLTALGTTQLTTSQSAITRQNRQRLTIVQAFLQAGVLPAPVLEEFRDRLMESDFRLPPGYRLQFGGEAAQRNDAIGNLMASVGILAVLMVAALVMSFRSFRLAGLVGIVAFLAVGLGLGALWLFGFPFGFMAIIGTMGLVGVAINDTIVVLAAIRNDHAARSGDAKALIDVVNRSTRHVIATSLTTMAGFLPLILDGGQFWPPMAVTIAGGVGGATLLALIFVPACYMLIMKRSFECADQALRSEFV